MSDTIYDPPGGFDELDVLSAKELCALPDPPGGDELLGPLLIRRHRLVLGAHSGEGKTTMGLQIIRAAVEGGDFLGYHGAGELSALVIDLEQGLKSVKRRLREAGLDQSDQVDYVRVPDGLSLDRNPEDVQAVSSVLEAKPYDIVSIGPLYKMHTGDSNAERETVDLMRILDAWRDHHGFALLTEAHCRKPSQATAGAKLTIHDLFGSSAVVRGAEVVLGLQRVNDGYARLHYLKDRDGDLPIGETWGLTFDRDHGFRRDPNAGKPSTLDQVRNLLQDQPYELGLEQLMTATGKKDRTVRVALTKLGAISERVGGSNGPSVYALPEHGDPQSNGSRTATPEGDLEWR